MIGGCVIAVCDKCMYDWCMCVICVYDRYMYM